MQSLCLDVKVLDINQEEIDLKQNFDDDDPIPSRDNTSFADEKTEDSTEYSDDDIRDEGFTFDDDESSDSEDSEDYNDDEFSFDDDELVIDDDSELFDSFDLDDSSSED